MLVQDRASFQSLECQNRCFIPILQSKSEVNAIAIKPRLLHESGTFLPEDAALNNQGRCHPGSAGHEIFPSESLL